MQKKRFELNPIITLIVLFVLIVIVIIITWVVSMLTAENTEILILPTNAEIIIDNEKYENGNYRLSGGTHQLRVSAEGFKTHEEEIQIDGNDNKIYLALEPAEGNEDYYLKLPESEQMLLNTIGDYRAAKDAAAYVAKDEVFKSTPYYDTKNRYQVFAEKSGDDTIISVKLNTCAKDAADYYKKLFLAWLQDEAKVNPDSYIIKYSTLCDEK